MKKAISQETMSVLEDYGIELTPEIERILTEESVKKESPKTETSQEETPSQAA